MLVFKFFSIYFFMAMDIVYALPLLSIQDIEREKK
jgi:hypothetical protein